MLKKKDHNQDQKKNNKKNNKNKKESGSGSESNSENSISNSNENENQNQNQKYDLNFYVRLILSILAMSMIFLNTIYGFFFPDRVVDCMEDKLFDWTESLNSYFSINIQHKNILLIISSFSLDISELYLIFLWITQGKSYRFCASLSIFYALRNFIQVK
jgi:hypothetical protein